MTVPDQEPATPARKPLRWPWIVAAALTFALIASYTALSMLMSAPSLAEQAAEACTEQFVPARLTAPDTARFTGVHTSVNAREVWLVQGMVDVENESGATMRSRFECRVVLTETPPRLIEVTIADRLE